jgi:V/A-type H+-transporting ATPase subunit I
LGLAGGMLGQAFNILGGMLIANGFNAVNWLPFLLIVLFGHTLNLAMSSLGAFVHPLRLTFVEYFKNAGYEGKGKEYAPLKKN